MLSHNGAFAMTVVGIAGGSASGKSTFAAAFSEALAARGRQVETFSMDRYARENRAAGPHFVSPSTGESLFDWNHPDACDLARLLADLDTRSEAADAPDVLLVEGLMALHFSELRQRLALRLFIDLDADVRALRRLLRDMHGGRASRDPEFIARYYLESARVGHTRYVEPSRVYADLTLRGDADFLRLIPMLCTIIEPMLPGNPP